jgi:hypothetical protein
VAAYVGAVSNTDDGARVSTRKRGEIRKAHSAAINSDRCIRVAADFSWIYQRLLGRRIPEGGIEQWNSGGNLHSYRDGNFGFGCSLDDSDVDCAVRLTKSAASGVIRSSETTKCFMVSPERRKMFRRPELFRWPRLNFERPEISERSLARRHRALRRQADRIHAS